jgi:hypothetical protein
VACTTSAAKMPSLPHELKPDGDATELRRGLAVQPLSKSDGMQQASAFFPQTGGYRPPANPYQATID